jgi:transcriptional regulator with XRE-family HTH domain
VSDDIRGLRERAGLTQAALAERAGVSRRTVATVEAGGAISRRSEGRLLAALAAKGPPPALRNDAIVAPAAAAAPALPEPPPEQTVKVEGRTIRIQVQRYQDLPVVSAETQYDTVVAVRAALTQLMQGSFAGASEMIEAMIADDRIAGVTSQRIDGLFGLPFELAPALEDDAFASALAEQVGTLWPRIAPDAVLRDLWLWGRFLGYGVAEKLYDTESPDGWVPTLKFWHPRYMYWRWPAGDEREGRLVINTRTGPVEVWISESDGLVHSKGPDGLEQIGHWVIYAPFGWSRGWVKAMVRSLAIPWLFRQFGYRDWGRYNEVHGLPIRGIIEPAEWDDAEKKKALREVASLAGESVVRLPQRADGKGFDLKLIEASAQTYDSFKLALEQANSSVAIVILGQNLTTEVKGGAYSAAQVHERVAAAILRSDATTLSATLRAQVLVEWAALNHGPKADGKAPRPAWDTEPPEDKKAAAEALNTTATGLATLRKTRLPVDYAKLCEQRGIPVLAGAPFPEPDDVDGGGDAGGAGEDDDPKAKKGKAALSAVRRHAKAIRVALGAGGLSRRDRAPLQGQAYVDELAEAGRDEAAKVLRGDVKALRAVVMAAKAGPDGKVDAAALRAELARVLGEMEPAALAAVLGRCMVLANLSGRYAVTKEVISE